MRLFIPFLSPAFLRLFSSFHRSPLLRLFIPFQFRDTDGSFISSVSCKEKGQTRSKTVHDTDQVARTSVSRRSQRRKSASYSVTQGGELFSDARRRVVQRRGHTRQLATAWVMDAAQGCKCNVSSHKCGYEREGRIGRDRREGKDTVFFPESACKKAIFLKRSTRRVSIIVVTLPNLSKK